MKHRKRRRKSESSAAPSSASQLWDALNDLYRTSELPIFRGRVSRRGVQNKLGFPQGSIAHKSNSDYKWARSCINRYEKQLYDKNLLGTVWEMKINIIEPYLKRLHSQRKLPINNQGLLNRTEILRCLKLPDMSPWIIAHRAPKLKKLFQYYDQIIKSNEYTQYKYSYLEGKLVKLLKSNNLQLTSGRMINRKWLARELGVSHAKVLTDTPVLRELIEHKDAELSSATFHGATVKKFRLSGIILSNIGITPFSKKHGRVFSFSEFKNEIGLKGSERIASAFIYVNNDIANPKGAYHGLLRFLNWLIANRSEYDAVITALHQCKQPSGMVFERAAFRYQQEILAEARLAAGPTKRHHVEGLSIIEKLGSIGIFSKIVFSRARRTSNRFIGSARPSFAEAKNIKKDTDVILEIARDAALYRQLVFEINDDTRAFAITLAKERAQRDDLPESLPEAIKILCDERLQYLRAASAKLFLEWHAIYMQGFRILDKSGPAPSELMAALLEMRQNPKGNRLITRLNNRYFPQNDNDTSLRNILTLIQGSFNSICPKAMSDEWRQRWRHLYSRVGGSRNVQSFLAPTDLAVSAALTLYLCESGANVSVALSLDHESLRPSQLPRHRQVVGIKARANYKPIYADIPDVHVNGLLSASEALNILKKAQSHLKNDKNQPVDIFGVFPSGGVLHTLEEWQFREKFKHICATSEELADLDIVPSMIRPTVLLSAQLDNPGDLSVAQRLAQHENQSTTFPYVRKLPYRLILEDRIRGYQNAVEVIICESTNNKKNLPAYTPDNWQERIQGAVATGLGVFCSNPFAGEQPDYPSGTRCLAVERCTSCQQIIIVAEPNAIAEMLLWQEAIIKAEPEWLEQRYVRWQEVWIPWQAFFFVVLNEKMSRGKLLAIKNSAKNIVAQKKQSPTFHLPEPW